jgi:hypothetical protein
MQDLSTVANQAFVPGEEWCRARLPSRCLRARRAVPLSLVPVMRGITNAYGPSWEAAASRLS